MGIDAFFREKIDKRISDFNLACMCVKKGIKLAEKTNSDDKDTFILRSRKLILDYHILTRDYRNMSRNLSRGEAVLSEKQLEEYQRKDFIRTYGEFIPSL